VNAYTIVDDALSPDFPLGDVIETFICREDAERFVRRSATTTLSLRTLYASRNGSSMRADYSRSRKLRVTS
jgi:hypothetical protein